MTAPDATKHSAAARPPVPDPGNLSAAQAAIAKAIIEGPRGRLDGPLAVWLNSPELADRAQHLGEFCRYLTSLPPHCSELLILCMAAHWQAGLEWAIHAPEARRAGLADDAIRAIAKGERPDFPDPDQAAVFRFATELLDRKSVSDATYAIAVERLGVTAVVDMVGILGYYGLISMTIKAFTIPVPGGGEDPFGGR